MVAIGQSGELGAKQGRFSTEVTEKAKPPKRSIALREKRYILLLSGPWWLESPRPPCGTLIPACSADCPDGCQLPLQLRGPERGWQPRSPPAQLELIAQNPPFVSPAAMGGVNRAAL
jgi:hypothetical protein